MDAILLIIGIVYGDGRIVFKSVQQCTYFLFSVNLLLVGVNYGQRTMQVCTILADNAPLIYVSIQISLIKM
jgi:hypothetical protein